MDYINDILRQAVWLAPLLGFTGIIGALLNFWYTHRVNRKMGLFKNPRLSLHRDWDEKIVVTNNGESTAYDVGVHTMQGLKIIWESQTMNCPSNKVPWSTNCAGHTKDLPRGKSVILCQIMQAEDVLVFTYTNQAGDKFTEEKPLAGC